MQLVSFLHFGSFFEDFFFAFGQALYALVVNFGEDAVNFKFEVLYILLFFLADFVSDIVF